MVTAIKLWTHLSACSILPSLCNLALDPTLEIAYFLTEPKAFDAGRVVDEFGAGLLIVWPRAATPAYLADARQNGLHIRCGLADNLSYEESYALFKRMVDMGADEVSSGRPDWIGRMIDQYNRTV